MTEEEKNREDNALNKSGMNVQTERGVGLTSGSVEQSTKKKLLSQPTTDILEGAQFATEADTAKFDEIDPALKYYTLEVPEDYEGPLGMRYIATEIALISPGLWAEKNDVQVDDEIWAVL
tara:strand:- start:1704 stop:2063 length:360 start_codon:yes stop_codon:yes gene_type:complete